jgi:hypothetical protein
MMVGRLSVGLFFNYQAPVEPDFQSGHYIHLWFLLNPSCYLSGQPVDKIVY